jgi:hypothetical protein
MILAAVVSLSLVVPAAFDIGIEDPASAQKMSMSQKDAVLRPLVSSATDCIVRNVVADPRLKDIKDGDIGDLIVDSMPACVERVRAMIDTYDRLFGSGSGEAFFMGPYLDVLPAMVAKQIKSSAE